VFLKGIELHIHNWHTAKKNHYTLYIICFVFQRELAKESAERRNKVAQDNASSYDRETKQRLAQAEASMEKQLGRVDKERMAVEKAMTDLQRVQNELEAESKSNALKPAALAGVLLFSVRSGLEVVAMTSAGGAMEVEGHMTAALIQAALALVSAAAFIFL